MSAGHSQPPLLHRHHKRASPARLPARDLVSEIGDIFGANADDKAKAENLVTSLRTIVQTFALPQTTLLNTEVIPVVVEAQPTPTTATSSPVITPTVAAVPSTSSSTSASSSSTSASSSSAQSSSSVLSSSSSAVTSRTSLASPVTTSAAPVVSHTSISSSLSASSSPSPTAADSSAASTASHSGLSGGAIGAIVVVAVLGVIAISIFVVRKTLLRKRQNRRITWNAGAFPQLEQESKIFHEKRNEGPLPHVPEKQFVPPVVVLPPPPMSYNNVVSPMLQPALGGPAVALTPAGTNVAIVRCTFVPNLPDELSITAGQTIRLLNEYDDGWVLCANDRGEQGVVPLECLEKTAVPRPSPAGYLGQGTGDWRMSRRASSLNGAVAGIPRY
ncbi:hypothetical protein BC835DRAFT_1537151 [Cytidiella melzeri]|nr:hypothetical protein BC835DRAFT_1537151 [Cytidiella melzeri]